MISTMACAYDLEIDGIYYDANLSSMSLTIVQPPKGALPYGGDFIVPEHVDFNGRTFKVTAIGKKAFYKSNIKSLTIASTVTELGESMAEDCIYLENLKLGAIYRIPKRCFYGCTALKEALIGNCVRIIESYAFGNLKNVIIEDGEETLKLYPWAFGSAKKLYIGRAIEKGESGAGLNATLFNGLFEDITFGKKASTIPNDMIYSIGSISQVLFMGSSLIQKNAITCDSIKSITFESYLNLDMNRHYMYAIDTNAVSKLDLRGTPEPWNSNCSGTIFKSSLHIPDVIVGCDVATLNYLGFSSFDRLIEHSPYPPKLYPDKFTKKTYLYATVTVPYGSLDIYKDSYGWDVFWNIQEADPSGINDAEINDDDEVTVIDTMGRIRYQGIRQIMPQLPSGIYILKCGSKCEKIIL